jgi:hypothetical protein
VNENKKYFGEPKNENDLDRASSLGRSLRNKQWCWDELRERKSNQGVGGAVTFAIAQDGNALSGTASMTNSTCLENAKLTGTVNGDDVLIDVTSGDTHATVHLTITGPDQIDGTYDAVSAGLCSGDTGIVDATR